MWYTGGPKGTDCDSVPNQKRLLVVAKWAKTIREIAKEITVALIFTLIGIFVAADRPLLLITKLILCENIQADMNSGIISTP